MTMTWHGAQLWQSGGFCRWRLATVLQGHEGMAVALVETAAGAHRGRELGFYRQEKEKRRPRMEIRK
jgi:hypothetical protein